MWHTGKNLVDALYVPAKSTVYLGFVLYENCMKGTVYYVHILKFATNIPCFIKPVCKVSADMLIQLSTVRKRIEDG